MSARSNAVAAAVLALALSGCATVSKPLQGEFTAISPHQAIEQESTGTAVRWGGRIVRTEPLADRTCFEVLSSRLDASGRPACHGAVGTHARFLACWTAFYDPLLFTDKRGVTFTGRIEGYENRRIGEYSYRFPRIAADVVYLWPEEDRTRVIATPAPWPWWGWW